MNEKNNEKNDLNKPLLVNKTLQKSRNKNVNYYNPTMNQPNLRTKITINRTLLWKNKIKNDNNNIKDEINDNDPQLNSETKNFYDYKNNKYNKMLLSEKKFSYLNGINLINKLNNLSKSEKSDNNNNNSKYFSPATLSSNNTNKDTNLSFSDQSFNNNIFMNNNPKATYRFLLHQASKNLNDSFSNIYKTNNKRSYSTPQNKSFNNTLNTTSENNISNNDENNLNNSIFKNRKELNKLGFGINLINNKLKNTNLETINISTKNENNFKEKNNKKINFNISDNNFNNNNNITLKKINKNNNIFNNFNYYKKLNNNYNNNLNNNNNVIQNYNHKRSYSNQNIENNNKFNTIQNIKTHRNIYVSKEKIINLNSIKLNYYVDYISFDIENLYILENKLRNILYKLNNFEAAHNECFEWLNSFFQSNLYYNIEDLFLDSNNRKNIIYFFKIELLCYCLCYDISYDNNLNKVSIILKSIFKLIHFNFLILLRFILHKTKMTSENYIWYEKLYNIIKNNLSMNLNKNDLDEYKIIQILNHNIKEICNYYKLIIDNIYAYDYFPNMNEYKFPFSLEMNINKIYEKKNIIASFFYDGLKFTETYSFEDIKKFFNIFLFRIPDPNSSYIISYRINFKDYINNNNNDDNNNFDNNDNYNESNYNNNNDTYSYNNNNNNNMLNIKLKSPFNSYFLPKINNNLYKYTLVLDLDETLIYVRHSKNNNKRTLIIRPYLYEFLNRMKKIYELILFSFGTPEYVDPIINIIEKKEKYFEYKLYRQHATIAGNDFVKDLKKLGRDMNKILIVDNLPQTFKLNKENGICINAFYGDINNDKNTLKNLAEILEEIRFDVEETNDIRISLKKRENLIISKVTSNEF